jgi:hypothetical protein
MTIDIGMLGADGIVLAADSEESWGDGFQYKTETVKIWSAGRSEGGKEPVAIALAGSGDSDYLQALKLEVLTHAFGPGWTFDSSQSRTEQRLLEFHSRHGIPFESDDPYLELLIGVSAPQHQTLFSTKKTLTKPSVHKYECIGCGREYATLLLSQFYAPNQLNSETCARVAIYVMDRVKDFIGGCGKDTQVVVMKAGKTVKLSLDCVRETESILRRASTLESKTIHWLCGREGDYAPIQEEALSVRTDLESVGLFTSAVQLSPEPPTDAPQSQPPSQE